METSMVDGLITAMVQSQENVSDLIFIQGKPPLLETYGRLTEFAIDTPRSLLTEELIGAIAAKIIGSNERLNTSYDLAGSCDTSYAVEAVARFRVSIYKQNSGRSIVMRKFPSEIPTLEKLGLPPVFHEIVRERNGIVLVTGATGSGKTTTLAALVNQLNQTAPVHILTLEDPIEFVHPAAAAAISQRELGRDFSSFAEGLRAALRQAPKVILLGEIRDRETMEIALTAAETGHLVLSTLHTVNAGQAINRILGFFDRGDEEQLRYRLSDTIRYIVSQRLVPRLDGGRHLISEVIGTSLRTRESIRYGEAEGKTFHEIIESGSTNGWYSFDQCLRSALEQNIISEDTALHFSTDKGRMRRDIDLQQKMESNNHGDDILSGLKMDKAAAPRAAAMAIAQAGVAHAAALQAAAEEQATAAGGGGPKRSSTP